MARETGEPVDEPLIPAGPGELPVAGAGADTGAPAPVRWGLGDAAMAFAAAIVLSNIVGGIAYVAAGNDESAIGVQLAGIVGLWIGLVGGPVYAARWKGSGSVARDFGFRVRARPDVPRGLLIGIACQLVLVPIVFLVVRLLFQETDLGSQAEDLTGDAVGVGFAVKAFVFVVLAPLVEELFFRGLLLRSLVRRFGPTTAVVVSAACFGIAHFTPGTVGSFVALFAALSGFGAVLAVLVLRYDRLGPALVAHAAFNAVTMVVLALN